MICLVTLYFEGNGYIPEKCEFYLHGAHIDKWGWNKGPGRLWADVYGWYKDMKKITGVDPRDGSFGDFQRIFKCNGIWAQHCNNKGLQFPLTCSYPPCNTCNRNPIGNRNHIPNRNPPGKYI